MLHVLANVQVAELHPMTLPRLGSRVRIPSSAPAEIPGQRLTGGQNQPLAAHPGELRTTFAPEGCLCGVCAVCSVIRESVTDRAQNDFPSTYSK